MITRRKPASFYDVFERKGPGQRTTHYCPGCGHGTLHKLIAECIDELGVRDRTVFLSPVGCSVFAYYYFDTGNIQCAHGRAPAVATGVRRTLRDAVIISYQGDGDLAGIGTAEILHAANRGENISVFFVNNAIYGMTGGQMAPTTLLGQKTLTTPGGRSMDPDGAPIGMAEVMDALGPPVYIERTSLATPAKIVRTRKAVLKALRYQVEGKGFAFVETLSPCPVNWKMDPIRSRAWMEETLEPAFPVKRFRDRAEVAGRRPDEPPVLSDDELAALFRSRRKPSGAARGREVPDQHVSISGFGGQGVMSAGVLLANCATAEGLHATWLPSYGPEMRGGTANASVIVSSRDIGSPVVDTPNVLIAMNGPSLDAFEPKVAPGGLVLVNSSIVSRRVSRSDVRAAYVPATEAAQAEGLPAAANVMMLAVYLRMSGVIGMEALQAVIPESIRNRKYLDANLRMVQRAIAFHDSRPPG